MELFIIARLNRFEILKLIKPKIIKYIDSTEQNILSFQEVLSIMNYCKEELMLPNATTKEQFIDFLLDSNILKEYKLILDDKIIKKYAYDKNVSLYEIALKINKNAYLSHYTALYLNNLTNNVPKNIYINIEQSKKENICTALTQEGIDKAFQRPARITNKIYSIENAFNKIYSINGKYTGKYGVKDIQYGGRNLSVTNIERTLIDITVRPQYAGDTLEVLNAFKMAKGKVSINRLNAILKKLNYIYPYHQAIGLYMEKAGYEEKQLSLLKKHSIEFDFYLANNIKDPAYSKEWRIYYPKELV